MLLGSRPPVRSKEELLVLHQVLTEDSFFHQHLLVSCRSGLHRSQATEPQARIRVTVP